MKHPPQLDLIPPERTIKTITVPGTALEQVERELHDKGAVVFGCSVKGSTVTSCPRPKPLSELSWARFLNL